jgi:hypothetical protein
MLVNHLPVQTASLNTVKINNHVVIIKNNINKCEFGIIPTPFTGRKALSRGLRGVTDTNVNSAELIAQNWQ